jgi:HEAT repeat protein
MNKLILISLVLALAGCQKSTQATESAIDKTAAGASAGVEGLRRQAKDIVKAGLLDENAHIRSNAAEIVASTKQTEMMPMVETMLTDELVPVRFAAAMAIGDLKYAPAKQSAKRLLSDKNLNVQLAGVYALTELGDKSYDKLIFKALTDRDQTVRSNAALILGKIGNKNALPQLKAVLRDTQSGDRAMFVAAEAIARLGDESIYPKLWTMLISTYADDRVTGIYAMGALGTMPARNAIITVLDDPIIEVRLAAAEQLGAMGDTAGEPEVLDFFVGKSVSDSERTNLARALAAMAIGRIKTPALTKYLPELLNNDSKDVRLAAAKAVLLID